MHVVYTAEETQVPLEPEPTSQAPLSDSSLAPSLAPSLARV